MLVDEAGEVSVESLVSRDELVRESESRHKSALFNPEDCAKRAREEDSLDGSEGNESLREGVGVIDPFHGPFGLLLDDRDIIDGLEKEGLLLSILDVSVNEKGVHLRVDVLHHDLESIEASGLGNLDLSAEFLSQVLVNNTVRGGKEGENILDEVSLIVIEFVPVGQVRLKINFVDDPEGGEGLLVHLPDVFVLDGEDHKPVRVILEERLLDRLGILLCLTLRIFRDESVLRLKVFGDLRGLKLRGVALSLARVGCLASRLLLREHSVHLIGD